MGLSKLLSAVLFIFIFSGNFCLASQVVQTDQIEKIKLSVGLSDIYSAKAQLLWAKTKLASNQTLLVVRVAAPVVALATIPSGFMLDMFAQGFRDPEVRKQAHAKLRKIYMTFLGVGTVAAVLAWTTDIKDFKESITVNREQIDALSLELQKLESLYKAELALINAK